MDSMNRFCDDIMEDILDFMSFDDKIKYECVCHQWKRCLFKKQRVLVIDGNENNDQNQCLDSLNKLVVKTNVDNISNRVTVLRKNSFESVLKKCPLIRKLQILGCGCDNEVLQLITDNCPLLEDLECELLTIDPYENHFLELGQKLGKNLKRFRIVYFTINFKVMKGFLYSCPKLETINCDVFAAIVDQRADFLPKLKNLRVRIRPTDEQHFEILGEKYSKTTKSLQSLTLYGDSLFLPSALKHISNITTLQRLSIEDLCSDTTSHPLTTNMLLIAENLENLRVLSINSIVFISGQFFQKLGHFKNLSKLTVNQNLFFTKCNSNINISQLSGCQSLKHLSILGFNFSELFFDDISLYLPQLKSIEFSLMTDNLITDHLFRMFEGMNQLEKFSFKLTVNKSKKFNISSLQPLMSQLIIITDNGLSNLITTCPKLRIIELKNIFTSVVGPKTLNAITTKAKSNRKMKFVLNISGVQYIISKSEINQNIEQDQIPSNLDIKLDIQVEEKTVHRHKLLVI